MKPPLSIEPKLRALPREVNARVKRVADVAREKVRAEIEQTKHDIKETAAELRGKVGAVVDKTRDHLRAEVQGTADDIKRTARKAADKIEDEARFIRTWVENPLKTGAVSPSSPELCREMAAHVEMDRPGLVIELGPGTGPVTEALLARGLAPNRLVLIEYDPDFCALLRERFPGVTVVQGDAYAMRATLRELLSHPVAAIVSSLPLMTRPPHARKSLLAEA
ncbi:MAG: rRNA adenine N-6-methyltransferase family protein, partial [Beijerinckiaceae bacterium]